MISSDDVCVKDITGYENYDALVGQTQIMIRKHKGRSSERPDYFGESQKGYEYYDTTNNKKCIWNGHRWETFKEEPCGILHYGDTYSRPTSLLTLSDAGFVYFDTSLCKPIFWTGESWVNASGNMA